MSKLVLILRGGLGSRVYSLLCARIFTRHLGCGLEFFWPGEDSECACPFELLFEDAGERRGAVDAAAAGVHVEDSLGKALELIAGTLAEGRDVYLTSFYAHLQPAGMSRETFEQELQEEAARLRPVAAVRARVRQLPPGMIGLQIRRQDHWRNTRYSPLALFTQMIDRACRENPGATFYLCTDSVRVAGWMRRRYGSRIWQTERVGERDSVAGVQEALAEIFTLAQTERLYRCHYGCFADLARLISRRPSILVYLRSAPRDYYVRRSDQRHDDLMYWNQARLAWRPRWFSKSLRTRWEVLRFRVLTWFITSDFYQLWPFHVGTE